MGWHHWCRPPGNFRIWLHRVTAGAQWSCSGCKRTWTLHRRNPTGHYAFWEWRNDARDFEKP